MLTICYVCNRIEKVESQDDVNRKSHHEAVSHGYCPECFSDLMAELSMSLPGWDRQDAEMAASGVCRQPAPSHHLSAVL